MVHPNNGLFSTKQNWAIKPWKTWRRFKCILKNERSLPEKATYFMIPNMWHSRKGKPMDIIKIPTVAKSLGGGGDEKAQHRRFLGHWNYSVWH